MITQKAGRTEAEKVFIVVKNTEAATVTTGMGVRFVGGVAGEQVSNDGISVVAVSGANAMINFAGIAKADIPADGVGIAQCYGYVDSIMFSFEANKTVGVVGIAETFLQPGGLSGAFTSAVGQDALSVVGIGVAGKTLNVWNTVNISGGVPYGIGFVRAI